MSNFSLREKIDSNDTLFDITYFALAKEVSALYAKIKV